MRKILYLTYDGMTDPLGQSQILPYLTGLSEAGYKFTILSFEKKERFKNEGRLLREKMSSAGIEWVPLTFSRRPPLLAKFYDAMRMRNRAIRLQKKLKFDMVHCRSYIAADTGLALKRKFGTKFFFDMRGFWADEKKDGGSWDTSKLIFRKVYQYYKKKEGDYLKNADAVISLTEAGKREIMRWPAYDAKKSIRVIPCCADMDLFSLTDEVQRNNAKRGLGILNGEFVLSYLGSIGTWYMLDEMLLFFRQLKTVYPEARFLFITHSSPREIYERSMKYGLNRSDFIIKELARREVPFFMKASDINVSFIKPVFSKISSSPTKLGEVLSMGIPVICNSGVGDVKEIVEITDGGIVIERFCTKDFDKAIEKIPYLLSRLPAEIRNASAKYFNLERGIELYKEAYEAVL